MTNFFILLFVSTSIYGAQSAKILLVKGKVTALRPGEQKAIQAKKGDVFPEDTSILTHARSLARIKFSDNTKINLGPKSKVVVTKMPKKEANIVNVLTGVIKAEVKKNKTKNKTKLIVKTQTAVMGVRGTKFQAAYSPLTNKTSLVTVEGEVVMAKAKASPAKELTVKE
ncbi:MAG: FecR family protein, partial [Bacteriovoracaceae bacterium]|nr:FecR family protein [Bacteriovoracaceae bacterium]